jgi:hypothetical protein
MAGELELGDWVIQVVRHKNRVIEVYPPGRYLSVDHYVRDKKSGKERWVFRLEVLKRREALSWNEFSNAGKNISGVGPLVAPRTKPIRDQLAADQLFSLWTQGGRISQK